MRLPALLLLSALSLSACGSGDSGDSLAKQCHSAMTLLCDMACDCVTGDGCALTADQGMLISFEDRDECLSMYVGMACPQADQAPPGFFPTCEAALGSAQCQNDPDEALLVPDECVADE